MTVKPRQVLAHLAELGTPPDGKTALRMSAGLNDSIDLAVNEVLPFVASGGAGLQFLRGPYGRGKTHYLRAMEQTALERGFVTAYVDSSGTGSPFESLQATYRAIAAAITLPSVNGASRLSRVNGLIEASFGSVKAAERSAKIERLREFRGLAPDYRNLALAYADSVFRRETRLQEDLGALLLSSTTYKQSIGALYSNNRGLPRPLGKLMRRNAGVWLSSLFSLPRALGYPGLVILFDETEVSSTGRGLRKVTRRRMEHLAHIRTFVDHIAVGAFEGCVVYYAVVGDFFDEAERSLAALSQRIERPRPRGRSLGANPRAITVDLDELTSPPPGDPDFYRQLGEKIIGIAAEAGLRKSSEARLRHMLSEHAKRQARLINEGAVREYVKFAAALAFREITKNGV